MSRRRAPENDWICRRCECPIDGPGPDPKHIGGGQNRKACKKLPIPILRSVHEMHMADFAKAAADAIKRTK